MKFFFFINNKKRKFSNLTLQKYFEPKNKKIKKKFGHIDNETRFEYGSQI